MSPARSECLFYRFQEMGMVQVLVLALCAVWVSSEEEPAHDEDKDLARCVKMTKKFTMTRICGLQQLAMECLAIDTPYVTEVMDYCYKVLNLDPINLHLTLPYICSNEEVIGYVADCLCKAVELVDDPSVEEDIEYDLREVSFNAENVQYHLSENEDYPHDLRDVYKNSMMHCMEYLNDVYSKRKFHHK